MEDYKFLFKVVLIGNAGVGEYYDYVNIFRKFYELSKYYYLLLLLFNSSSMFDIIVYETHSFSRS